MPAATARELGDSESGGDCLGLLGNAYAVLGEVRQAIEYYEAALEMAKEIGHLRGESVDLGNLGLAYPAGSYKLIIQSNERLVALAGPEVIFPHKGGHQQLRRHSMMPSSE